ncbi:hypothetical protein [Paraburkholderia lycopersici]|nr:hypothetical protein [Paraburkholderia lycopersici]
MVRDAWGQVSVRHTTPDQIALTSADFEVLMAASDRHEPRAKHFTLAAARVHSPDFMVASPSLEAVGCGDFQIVIGEVHPAVHTVSQPVAQPFCPYAEAIREEVAAALSPTTIVAADSPRHYQRSHIDWLDVDELAQVATERRRPCGPQAAFAGGRGRGCLARRDSDIPAPRERSRTCLR